MNRNRIVIVVDYDASAAQWYTETTINGTIERAAFELKNQAVWHSQRLLHHMIRVEQERYATLDPHDLTGGSPE